MQIECRNGMDCEEALTTYLDCCYEPSMPRRLPMNAREKGLIRVKLGLQFTKISAKKGAGFTARPAVNNIYGAQVNAW